MAQSGLKGRAAAARAKQEAQIHSAPAPIGGLNSKDAWANMPETDALILDNCDCQPTWVQFRGGHLTLAKFTGNCETLMGYAGLQAGARQLFAAVNNAGTHVIYRVDNVGGGSVGSAVVTGLGSTILDYNQFGTGSGSYLIVVNGVDAPLIYDGTTWQAVTTTSSPFAWTGGPSPLSSLRFGGVYKQRLWFIQLGTMNVYYLPQNVVAGALTLLNIGPNFKLGGYIQAIITISIDNSAGTNDYIAFLSSEGEIIQFIGYDPASVTTFSVSAHYRIGRPIGFGRNCWQKMGEDAAVVCADGVIMLSEAMLTDRAQTQNQVTDKIRYGINQAMASYGADPGWQIILFPDGNKLVLNVPTSGTLSTSYQFSMNTLTGAWTTWGLLSSPLNAFAWEVWQGDLYYGTNGTVELADIQGGTDNGNAINIAMMPAFNYMGDRDRIKLYTQMQVIFQSNGTLALTVRLEVDFDQTVPSGVVPLSQAKSAVWGSALWNVSMWGDAQQVVKPWIGVSGAGQCATPYMKFSSSAIQGKLQSINYMYKSGTLFYGAAG